MSGGVAGQTGLMWVILLRLSQHRRSRAQENDVPGPKEVIRKGNKGQTTNGPRGNCDCNFSVFSITLGDRTLKSAAASVFRSSSV